MSRFDFLPSYHYEVNTDGIINNPAVKELRGCKIYGADGGVGSANKNIAKIKDWGSYKWLAGTIKDIEPETGSFVINSQSGMYHVPLPKLMPDIEADKEYYLFATAPQAKNQFVYLYGEAAGTWKFGTKKTILQSHIDHANGMSIYGAADGSDTQYTGFMVIPAELYDAEQTAFEPYMTPGKYNIPFTVSENSSASCKKIYVETDRILEAGDSTEAAGFELPYERNIITAAGEIQPSAVEYEYYTY